MLWCLYRFPDRTAETRSSSSAVGVQPDTSWELGFIEFVSSILIDTTFSDWYRIGGSFKANVAAVSSVIRQTWQPSWCWNLLTTLYWVLRDGKSYLWKKPWELSFRTLEGNIRIKNNFLRYFFFQIHNYHDHLFWWERSLFSYIWVYVVTSHWLCNRS